MPHLPGLLLLVSLTPWQATVNPRRCQRLLNTHRQFWLSVLWGHCSFLLGPGVHKVLFVPSKNLFPQSCGSSVIKSHCLQSQIAWGFSVPLPDPQIGKFVVGPRTFLTLREFLWYNHSATRWRTRRTCAHLLQELQNCNLLQEEPGRLQSMGSLESDVTE